MIKYADVDRNLPNEKKIPKGTWADKIFGVLPSPNPLAVQLNWAAAPNYGRWLKVFSGRPKGEIPLNEPFGYWGLGFIPFRGAAVRFFLKLVPVKVNEVKK